MFEWLRSLKGKYTGTQYTQDFEGMKSTVEKMDMLKYVFIGVVLLLVLEIFD